MDPSENLVNDEETTKSTTVDEMASTESLIPRLPLPSIVDFQMELLCMVLQTAVDESECLFPDDWSDIVIGETQLLKNYGYVSICLRHVSDSVSGYVSDSVGSETSPSADSTEGVVGGCVGGKFEAVGGCVGGKFEAVGNGA